MLIEEMTVKQCHEFLVRMDFGRLGCVHDNQPYVVPIYFAYEPDRLYGFSTLGRKIEWMRSNPRVCVEVDEVIDTKSWNCVIASGRYEELPNASQYVSERQRAYKLLEKRFLWWQTAYAAEQPRHAHQPSLTILYCIHVAEMTGRRAEPDQFDAGRTHQKISG
jgi:nitroimidazol reductase NimA-like FMN-containing flavoprotein (pyridoxamine 5'-phosphate oxidase superfamily)